MKTILITGINGFLGSHLAKGLQNNYRVIGLAKSKNNLYRLNDCNFMIYSSRDELGMIFKENKIHAVINAATVYEKISFSRDELLYANIILPIKIYELSAQFNVIQYLNTDTFINNKNNNYMYLQDYKLSKKHVLEWLQTIESRCQLVNMKLFHIYGPNDSPKKFIPQIITKFKNSEPFVNVTFGEQTRDFIFISDVVSAYKLVLEKTLLKEKFVEYEIGTGKDTSIKEVLLKVREITDSKTVINFGALEYRQNEIMKSKANIKDLCDLGWEPKIKIEEGLKSTIETFEYE